MGTLSAGIAHEINNPLSFVLTNLNVLQKYQLEIINTIHKNETNKDIIDDFPILIEETIVGINRIKDIVNRLVV